MVLDPSPPPLLKIAIHLTLTPYIDLSTHLIDTKYVWKKICMEKNIYGKKKNICMFTMTLCIEISIDLIDTIY